MNGIEMRWPVELIIPIFTKIRWLSGIFFLINEHMFDIMTKKENVRAHLVN